ncbi:MAG: FAD-dependent oxidoreductase [Gammaproteobacteria bacterium]|nr:FAD-dependent oxidoreductase [Gammaproteobacteria bacterium]NDA43738.1 FAD-dependent oxidoreductase [Gammaproteobacteria bacterium]
MSRIAIIGTGIAGLTAAWHLRDRHELVLFEANDYVGGHTATKDVEQGGRRYAIDTGFIVFNDWTYPNFIALLTALGVPWQFSNMSFSLRCERSGLEYNGTSVNSLFAQRRNLLNPGFLRMIADILRFNSRARELLAPPMRPGHPDPQGSLTLGDYLARGGYSRAFIEHYIIPMGRAIWSATGRGMLEFPARFFVDFFDRHGFLNVDDRPTWRTVTGGSREYARRLTAEFGERIRLSTPVQRVRRSEDGVWIGSRAGDERFDQVFFACHSDQALAMLEDPSEAEQQILGAFPYQENDAVLHTDRTMLPRTPLARAAWNYHLLDPDSGRVALTYDMNVLQAIDADVTFMVTLNRTAEIDPSKVLGRYTYHHPVYTPAAVVAQGRRRDISGVRRTHYCGAYWRYGFHEDGVVSGLWALEDFARVTGTTPPPAPLLEPVRRSLRETS